MVAMKPRVDTARKVVRWYARVPMQIVQNDRRKASKGQTFSAGWHRCANGGTGPT